MASEEMESRSGDATTGLSRRGFMLAAGAAGGSTVLAACTGGSGGTKLSSAGKPIKGGPKTTPNTDVIYPEGYAGPIASHKGPVTKERATLNVVVAQDVGMGDWATNEFTKWYEKRTNVHVNFKTVAGGTDTMTKVNAMIASGDLPDAFLLNTSFTPSQLKLYGPDQKLFRPLNDIIDSYGVEVKRIFKDYPDTKKLLTMPDGKIYSMPDINDCFHCKGDHGVWIYKPWLEELGLKMPETTDEFEAVLKAFKTKDPNKNGSADEVPLTLGSPDDRFDDAIMNSFTFNPGEPWLYLENGKVQVAFDKPGWREGLKYLNRLYKQGLIDPKSFTRTAEQVQRLGNAKTVTLGTIRTYYWAGFLDIVENAPHPRYLDYVCVPTLKGPDGFRQASWSYYQPYGLGKFAVTKASKIPEIAVMWADGFYELEAVQRQYAGVEGKEWRWAKKGETGISGNQAVYKNITVWPPKPGRAWIQNGIMYRSNDFRLGEATNPKTPTFEQPLYEAVKEAYYPFKVPQSMILPPIAMSQTDAGQLADLQTTINNFVTQSETNFIIGKQDPNDDGAWNSYLNKLKQMKLSSYLDINQKAFEGKS
ncbi:MAG TPA: substrate-binding domain-containing protein [Mycobacteriales bacterium]|nr:substrate-binding domain-containing protein [Mycobacteriales bacterium]